MGGHGRSTALLALVAFGVLVNVASAKTHDVGGSIGWAIPSDINAFADWAAAQTFKVGDILVFKYSAPAHTVLQVSEADYESCAVDNPIESLTTGEDKITLFDSDTYFICGAVGHCAAGQKVHITLGTSSTAPSTPAPTAASGPKTAETPADSPASSSAEPPAHSPASPSASAPVVDEAQSPTGAGTSTPPTKDAAAAPGPSSTSAEGSASGLHAAGAFVGSAFMVVLATILS